MCDAIAHRGPDDEGYCLLDLSTRHLDFRHGDETAGGARGETAHLNDCPSPYHAGLGHRRFSIVDLSPGGHQPFHDPQTDSCLVFNGEIYNYLELRSELVAHGVRFVSRSDTEVFLRAYLHWGVTCFERFNGFWAAVLFDGRSGTFVFSRDRIGKRHLYWAVVDGSLYFASEIKSLLVAAPSLRTLNRSACAGWLLFGRKDVDERTMFADIHSFPAGSYARIGEKLSLHPIPYWRIPFERLRETDIHPDEAARRLRDVMFDAVRLRLRADVPVGVELSGGVDSSIITAIASELSGSRCDVYTVKFDDPSCDEEPYARAVAERTAVDYTVLRPGASDLLQNLYEFTWLHEEPYHSPNLRTNQLMWESMRARGVKVSLNGAAGDECFAGYRSYFGAVQLQHLLEGNWRKLLRNVTRYSEDGRVWRTLPVPLVRLVLRNLQDRHPLYRRGRKVSVSDVDEKVYRTPRLFAGETVNMMQTRIMPYWLASGDRDTMGIPIEVRLPFLDYRVVELAFRLPAAYLLRDGWHKWILRRAFESYLPHEVVWRKRKMGFPFPLHSLLRDHPAFWRYVQSAAPRDYLRWPSRLDHTKLDWPALSFILWYQMVNGNTSFWKDLAAFEVPAEQPEFHSRFFDTCRNP